MKDVKGIYQHRKKEWFARWYTWIEWDKSSDRFSAWPAFDTKLNMYKDEYFTKNTWIWDGKPHWAYNTDAISYQDARDAIEWTPNVINASAAITGNDATIRLSSFTPNLKEYQVKKEGEWMKCDSVVDVELAKDREEIAFRVLNKAGVAGPEYKMSFVSK